MSRESTIDTLVGVLTGSMITGLLAYMFSKPKIEEK